MSIKNRVKPVVDAFAKAHPSAAKVDFTGGDRTAEKQLSFILERQTQYPLIRKAFITKFKVKEMPSEKSIPADQKKWCLDFIMEHAGKAGAYAHVGGKAQDLWVEQLQLADREALQAMLLKAGFKIIYENVNGAKSDYNAKIGNTNVFHVYVD